MGQCVSGPKPRRPDPVHDTQRTSWDSLQPFDQVDLKMTGAILPLPAAGPTLEVAVNGDEGYSTLETVRDTTSSKKPVNRVTFNPQVQVQEFERETHERIRLIIIPDSESDSLESPVPPRARVARRKPRQTVVTFKWDDVLREVYGQPLRTSAPQDRNPVVRIQSTYPEDQLGFPSAL